MTTAEILLAAVGLSMDAFAVSISDGIVIKRTSRGVMAAFLFGLFQGLMPMLGYFLGSAFSYYISAYDHIIALAVLGFIGGKMVFESASDLLHKRTETTIQEPGIAALFFQALATSVDAFIAGISFAAIGIGIFGASGIITSVTFIICLAGVLGGRKFGSMFGAKASLFGGLILIALGVKTFLEHIM